MNGVKFAGSSADPNSTAILGTAPTAPSYAIPEVPFSPTPADSMGITSRSRVGSVTAKGKKGKIGILNNFLKSRKQPEISRANFPNADDAVKSQATVASNGTVAERPAPQPPTAPQQLNAVVAGLAKAVGANPRRRDKEREGKANDADIARRLQRTGTDADPTRLYRNLVKIRQG